MEVGSGAEVADPFADIATQVGPDPALAAEPPVQHAIGAIARQAEVADLIGIARDLATLPPATTRPLASTARSRISSR